MATIYALNTNRSYYDVRYAARESISVGELIEELERLDPETKIVFRNDNGYTYGFINTEAIAEVPLYEQEGDE